MSVTRDNAAPMVNLDHTPVTTVPLGLDNLARPSRLHRCSCACAEIDARMICLASENRITADSVAAGHCCVANRIIKGKFTGPLRKILQQGKSYVELMNLLSEGGFAVRWNKRPAEVLFPIEHGACSTEGFVNRSRSFVSLPGERMKGFDLMSFYSAQGL